MLNIWIQDSLSRWNRLSFFLKQSHDIFIFSICNSDIIHRQISALWKTATTVTRTCATRPQSSRQNATGRSGDTGPPCTHGAPKGSGGRNADSLFLRVLFFQDQKTNFLCVKSSVCLMSLWLHLTHYLFHTKHIFRVGNSRSGTPSAS